MLTGEEPSQVEYEQNGQRQQNKADDHESFFERFAHEKPEDCVGDKSAQENVYQTCTGTCYNKPYRYQAIYRALVLKYGSFF
jgi:hypothetical protein